MRINQASFIIFRRLLLTLLKKSQTLKEIYLHIEKRAQIVSFAKMLCEYAGNADNEVNTINN